MLRSVLALAVAGVCGAMPALAASSTPRALDRVPMFAVDAAQAQRAVAAVPRGEPHGAQPIAATVSVSAGLDDGAWGVEGNEAVWRLRLYSAGARLMLAHLDRLNLPQGASLRFMSADGSVVQGPWTREDRKRASMWTPMVPGDTAVLEVRTPLATRDAVRLHVASIGHGIVAPFEKSGIEPKSGSCNIDVLCTQGDAWREPVRSVVRLQIPEGRFVGLCSGTLMNNTAQDQKPYVLTAHHCGIQAGNADGVVTYFRFQTSTCGGTPDGNLGRNLSGATVRMDNVTSDHTLIELDAKPPTGFAAYYAGFDASDTAIPSSGASIHHPSGDEKRISLYVKAPTKATPTLEGNTIQAFKVFWSQGVTEQGSSGAGLLDQTRKLVGVLSGGASSCSNPTAADFFGRLHVAWNAGLSTVLDPRGTGRRTQCGAPQGQKCTSDTNLAPIANADRYVVPANVLQRALLVLDNDSDADADVLTIARVTSPSQGGTAEIVAGRTRIRYTPKSGFTGVETFSYKIRDGHGGSDFAKVRVEVIAS